ncbi:amidohydrolase family protein [Streptomyces sp. NPDC001549]|uniref:amidohydrolase family protein n=1 Tax=Streptomyces sp. NPDC001549 TaxID=3364586 RepID=UPI00368A8CC2
MAPARAANDAYAELVARFPGRFRAFAALPLPHVDATLREVTRALDGPRRGRRRRDHDRTRPHPGRSPLPPRLQELERRGAVLCIHPAGAGAAGQLITERDMTWMVGAPVEDTVAIMRLVLAGIPAHNPRMRILASHLGGALPLLPRRLDDHLTFESPGPAGPLRAVTRNDLPSAVAGKVHRVDARQTFPATALV